MENARRNPTEIQQLCRVKTILNKEVEAEKAGKAVNKQLMEFNNDPNKSQKKYQVSDLPQYVLEEAGCVKKTRVKERQFMVRYTAEAVENYMGDQDVDTILKNIEDPAPVKKKEVTKKCTDEEVPEDIKRQINEIAVSMVMDHIKKTDKMASEPEEVKEKIRELKRNGGGNDSLDDKEPNNLLSKL